MFKLIASDLDGTLLNSSSKLPPSNKEYIQKAMSQGVRFVINSGRSYLPLVDYGGLLGLNRDDCYGIAFNGGIVYKTKNLEKINEWLLPREVMLEVANGLKEFDVQTLVYTPNELLNTLKVTKEVEFYSKTAKTPVRELKDFSEIKTDVSKILAIGENAKLQTVHSHFHKILEGKCNSFFSHEILYEFTAIGADKGAALQFLANYLGVQMSEVIAVGDNYNDIQMIEAAGLGIAVANAVPELRAIADYVTNADNNEGVFKEIIEKFIL